jgi:hypothetical protein
VVKFHMQRYYIYLSKWHSNLTHCHENLMLML